MKKNLQYKGEPFYREQNKNAVNPC